MIAWIRIVLAVSALVLLSLVLFPIHLLFLWLEHPWRNRLPRYWHKFALRMIGVRVHVHGEAESRAWNQRHQKRNDQPPQGRPRMEPQLAASSEAEKRAYYLRRRRKESGTQKPGVDQDLPDGQCDQRGCQGNGQFP